MATFILRNANDLKISLYLLKPRSVSKSAISITNTLFLGGKEGGGCRSFLLQFLYSFRI